MDNTPKEEPTMEDKAAEEALLATVDDIMENELQSARRDNETLSAIMRLFGVTPRQAALAIQRAQSNIADIMTKRGEATPDQRLTIREVGKWAEENLTYDQRLGIISYSVGAIAQLDWMHRRDPLTGERLNGPEYQI